MKQTKEPSPIGEPIIHDLLQGTTSTTIVGITPRREATGGYAKELEALMTRAEVEAMLEREKEKASISTFGLDLQPPYLLEVMGNLILNMCVEIFRISQGSSIHL